MKINSKSAMYFTDRSIDAGMMVELRKFASVTFNWQTVTTDDTRESTQLEASARARGFNVVYPYRIFDTEVLFIECTAPELRQLREIVLQRIENMKD